MRKLAIAATAMFVLGIAAFAYAQAPPQENTYGVTASTNPTRAGSSAKPVPISLRFGYTVGERQGRRPAVIKRYSIRFAGIRVNSSAAAVCSRTRLEDPNRGVASCPRNSVVGSGYIENATGNTADPNDRSIPCNAKLSVVNHGSMRASIFIEGDPNAQDERERCTIPLRSAIPARFVNRRGENSLDFTVPDSLTHPGSPNLSNAVTRVTSSIRRIVRRGRGFFESRGGCVGGKRRVRVLFTPENGPTVTQTTRINCRR